jgi:hypothetical protein
MTPLVAAGRRRVYGRASMFAAASPRALAAVERIDAKPMCRCSRAVAV